MAKTANLTTTDLAKLIDVTPAYIRKLTSQGTISRARDEEGNEMMGRYSLLAVRDYCRWMRSAMKVDDAGEARYSALRNQKMAAEAEMSQLRLKQIKGELHPAVAVEFCMTQMVTHCKQQLLAIPSKIARQCVGKTFHQILEIIKGAITQVLTELSGYDPDQFAAQNREFLEKYSPDRNGASDSKH
jgi:phage terminase Nu1 subunit (DNA packaging protein)